MCQRRLAAVLMASAGFAGLPVRGARADIAATFTGSGGNWGTAGNWSVDAVPINAGTKLYDVTIGSSTVSFNVPGNGQIDALAMSGTTLNLQTGCNLSVPNGGPVADANVTAGGATFSDNEPSSNLASTSLTAENAGGISFPQITTVVTDSSQESYFTASGTGSTVSLANLTAINETYWGVSLTAQNGGTVQAPALTSVTYANNVIFEGLTLTATGSGSVVAVAGLGGASQSHLSVDVATGGAVNWGSPTVVTDSSITLDTAGTLNTAALTTITSTNLTATDGAAMTLPAVTAFATDSVQSATFTASAAGSVLSLPNLGAVNETYWGLTLAASGGGTAVNVPLLGNSPQTRLTVNVSNGGAVVWGSPSVVQDSSISVTGTGTLNIGSITNLDSTSLTASGGAVLTFGAVNVFSTNQTGSATFSATGASSDLALPALATVHEIFWNLELSATSGGYLDLRNLSLVTADGSIFDSLDVTSAGAGSVVNLSSLDTTTNLSNQITINDQGSVLLGAGAGTRYLSFTADFANADGPLDVYLNGVLLDAIAANNLNTAEGYQLTLPGPLGVSRWLISSPPAAGPG